MSEACVPVASPQADGTLTTHSRSPLRLHLPALGRWKGMESMARRVFGEKKNEYEIVSVSCGFHQPD